MDQLIDNLARLIDRGGMVMFPLLALSVLAIGLIIERGVFWLAIHGRRQRTRLTKLHRALRLGKRAEAAAMVKGHRSPYATLATRLLKEGTSDAVAVDAAEEVRPRLDRFMVTLSTIITAAPLLGILGTVIGIIRSFNLLGSEETLTDPRVVSVGIAEALVTTALGLVIALMTLFPYMIYKGQVDRALGRMESLIAAAQQGTRDGDPATPSADSGSNADDPPEQRPDAGATSTRTDSKETIRT